MLIGEESHQKKFQIHSARFQVPKTALRAPKSKNGLQKPRKTPLQNGVVDIWVMRFHFRASIKPILKKNPYFPSLWSRFPILKGQNQKTAGIFFVYVSLNLKLSLVALLAYKHHWL